MANTYKTVQLAPAAATLSTLYTAASTAVVSTIAVANTGSTVTQVRIAIRPAGAAINIANYIVYDTYINGNDSLFLTLGISLAATDVVSVYSLSGTLSFSLFVSEIV